MYGLRLVREEFLPALIMLVLFTGLCGLAYPLGVTIVASALCPDAAAGSIIAHNGAAVGSVLLGQPFTRPEYFWGRPSATAPMPCNGAASSGSNLSADNPALSDAVAARLQALTAADSTAVLPVPVDLLTASGSGLDPHLTPAAVLLQVPRVARARGLDEARLRAMVLRRVETPWLDAWGASCINVLQLNLALDRDGEERN